MPDRMLVTGGAGFVGSHLVERLVEMGKDVIVYDNSWRGSQKHLKAVEDKIEFIEGDIRNYDSVNNAMKNADIVFHLASLQGTKFFYEYPDLGLEVGLIGNLNVARVMKENKIKRILFTSSSEVYSQPNVFPTQENHPLIIPDPKNPRWSYSVTKISGEVIFFSYGKKYGFDTSVVRIHNAYGPRMGWQHVIPEFIKKECR
jgi:nucleoside-diphosphate-sugar epimerase